MPKNLIILGNLKEQNFLKGISRKTQDIAL